MFDLSVTASTFWNFFQNKEGPIGLLIGGLIVGVFLTFWIQPWYELPERMDNAEKRLKQAENRIENMDQSLDSLKSGLNILICTDPNIGERYKKAQDCGDVE